jgi:hypothetical protein
MLSCNEKKSNARYCTPDVVETTCCGVYHLGGPRGYKAKAVDEHRAESITPQVYTHT